MKRFLAILKNKLMPAKSRLITMAIMIAVFYCMFMFADLENERISDSERHYERSVNIEEMSDQESEEMPASSLVNYCKDRANESRASSWVGIESDVMEPSEYTVECIEHLE
ncbi:hypothetical protein ACDZ29_14585 [Peribacillus sp. RS7]|jgi:hypothetical protein|uniref:hypothetical protein n=1 Tax=unclassified Peribacillus TaxID=2675266 RepID=UPI0025A13644|nr:hypothetical protein [Peribacillus sp. ACCC06369]MDM5357210.1 hypothetical protein [Peribacillus sp. ACCC06369]